MPRNHNRGANGSYGMNWIRQSKRLAIYLRDGMACCWCGLTIEDGARLTLDHMTPRARGGSNHETNLFTACRGCNSRRKHYSIAVFALTMSRQFGGAISTVDIIAHIRETVRRPIDVAGAEELMQRRGGFVAALLSSSDAA